MQRHVGSSPATELRRTKRIETLSHRSVWTEILKPFLLAICIANPLLLGVAALPEPWQRYGVYVPSLLLAAWSTLVPYTSCSRFVALLTVCAVGALQALLGPSPTVGWSGAFCSVAVMAIFVLRRVPHAAWQGLRAVTVRRYVATLVPMCFIRFHSSMQYEDAVGLLDTGECSAAVLHMSAAWACLQQQPA